MQTYKIPNQLHGDTFDGAQFEVKINNVAKNLTSTAIKIDFKKKKKTGELVKTISVGSGITKVDAANGIFKIDPFVADMPIGIYYYDIQFTDGAVIKTYIEGTWEITQDTTD